jgi:hypothetical protein
MRRLARGLGVADTRPMIGVEPYAIDTDGKVAVDP